MTFFYKGEYNTTLMAPLIPSGIFVFFLTASGLVGWISGFLICLLNAAPTPDPPKPVNWDQMTKQQKHTWKRGYRPKKRKGGA